MVWRSLSSSCHLFAVCFTSGILAYSIALSNSRVFPACSSHAEACTFRFSNTVCSAAALSSRSFISSARGKAVSGEISASFVSK